MLAFVASLPGITPIVRVCKRIYHTLSLNILRPTIFPHKEVNVHIYIYTCMGLSTSRFHEFKFLGDMLRKVFGIIILIYRKHMLHITLHTDRPLTML